MLYLERDAPCVLPYFIQCFVHFVTFPIYLTQFVTLAIYLSQFGQNVFQKVDNLVALALRDRIRHEFLRRKYTGSYSHFALSLPDGIIGSDLYEQNWIGVARGKFLLSKVSSRNKLAFFDLIHLNRKLGFFAPQIPQP